MGFWIFMFICDLLIPLMMVIFGRIMEKHTPKDINYLIGYRTSMSMKNADTWTFAHELCGKLWWRTGWAMLILSLGIQLPFVNNTKDTIGLMGLILCTVQCVVLIVSIFPVEKALKNTFNSDGSRKE